MSLTANHDPEEEEARKLQLWLRAQFMSLPREAANMARQECGVSKDEWRLAMITGGSIINKADLEKLQLFVRQWKAGAYVSGADPFLATMGSIMHKLPGMTKQVDGGEELAFEQHAQRNPEGPRPRLLRPTYPEQLPEKQELSKPREMTRRMRRDDAGFQALRALIPEKRPYGFNSEVASICGLSHIYVAWLAQDHYFGPGADDKWTKLRAAITKVKADNQAKVDAFETLRKLIPENKWRGFNTDVARSAEINESTVANLVMGKFFPDKDKLYERIKLAIEQAAMKAPPPLAAPAKAVVKSAPMSGLPDLRSFQVAELIRSVEQFGEELVSATEVVKRLGVSLRTISLQLRQLQRSYQA